MNQTTNYQLNQWEATDRVKREDFTADNARLDAAMKTIDDSAAGWHSMGIRSAPAARCSWRSWRAALRLT